MSDQLFDEQLEVLAAISIPEDYDALDRYQDFQKVFLDTDQGRRVLKQILSWGGLLNSHLLQRPPIDPWTIVAREGQRNLAIKIFRVMLEEPKKKPEQQKTQDTEE